MKKRLLAFGAAASIGLTSVAGLGLAGAAGQTDGASNLIDKLSQRFNLNREEVQQVFEEEKAAREAEREQELQSRLDEAVQEGALTRVQADALEAKHEEMKTFRDSLKDKTEEERREAMKEKMDEFKQWLEDNDIPESFRLFGKGHGRGGPRGGELPANDQ